MSFHFTKKHTILEKKKGPLLPPPSKKTKQTSTRKKKRWKKILVVQKHMHGLFVLQKHPTSPKPFAAKRHGSPPPSDLFSIDATVGKFQSIRCGRLRHVDRHDVDGLQGRGGFFVAGSRVWGDGRNKKTTGRLT